MGSRMRWHVSDSACLLAIVFTVIKMRTGGSRHHKSLSQNPNQKFLLRIGFVYINNNSHKWKNCMSKSLFEESKEPFASCSAAVLLPFKVVACN